MFGIVACNDTVNSLYISRKSGETKKTISLKSEIFRPKRTLNRNPTKKIKISSLQKLLYTSYPYRTIQELAKH